jgi:hypothetical protein
VGSDSRKLLFTFGAPLALCLACRPGSPSKSHPSPPEKSESAGEPSPSKEAALPMPPGTPVSFEEALGRVTRLRGLASKHTVQGLRVTRENLLAHVERAVDLETPPEALAGTEAMLVGLGLVPRDFGYRATMLRLLSEKLAGLYDPHLGTMMIRDDLSPVDAELTLLHELVHALQDQYYDLDEIVAWTKDDTDRSAALSCLAEGDATLVMLDAMAQNEEQAPLPGRILQEKMAEEAAALSDIPPIIQRSLSAPYQDGLNFVFALKNRGGWAAVDAAWASPPTTSEQILHLDKFDQKEAALVVEVPKSPGASFDLVLHDTWGEQNLRLAFEEWLSPEKARKAAAGWGGDRIVAYQSDTQIAVAWHIDADNEGEAREMSTALAEGLALEKSSPKALADTAKITCAPRLGSGSVWALAQTGAHVLLHAVSPRASASSVPNESAATCEWLNGWMMTHSAVRNGHD